jgi:glycine/D-amino acid oxidase-like deaminating enzyme
MNTLPPNEGRSWWLREALARPEFAGEPCPPLDTDTKADVVILGGGYTGMWSAWFLKELDPGLDIVLLEQDICGGGPSGRNGGFVNSFWDALDFLAERYGDASALRICRAGQESVDDIGRFCTEHEIDAWFAADGSLSVASSTAQIGAWADLVMAVDRMGLSDIITVLSPDEVRALVDSPVFHAGVLTKAGATVHPARLARGLRRVLLERGVRIHEGTHVSRFGAGDPAIAVTGAGTVRAGAAVLAVNAWAQHWRRFKRAITVRGSYIVLTAPAPDRLAAINWTTGLGVSDERSAIHYVRTTPDGRIAFGIGGMQPDLARRIDPRFGYDEASIRVAVDDLHRMFPSFADVPIEAGWGGPIDVSADHLPFFGTLESGNVHFGLGFTGNGVGPAHLGGRILAHRVLAKYDEVLALPLVDLEPRRFPPEPIRSMGAMVTNRAIHRRDVALDGEEIPNPFVDFVAKLPRRLGYNLGP